MLTKYLLESHAFQLFFFGSQFFHIFFGERNLHLRLMNEQVKYMN